MGHLEPRGKAGSATAALIAAAVLLVAGSAGASHPPTVPGPDMSRLRQYYPASALQEGISGLVVLDCAVVRNGRVADCRVVREQPIGWGFGAASVRAAEATFRHRARAGETPGTRVRFPMRWKSPRPRVIRDSFLPASRHGSTGRGFVPDNTSRPGFR